jgi:pSer/pThr/pTyr-binding forkhead associated (FHA) protein
VLRAGGREYELGDLTVIGRSKRCDVVLNDPNASRQHAEVRREGDDFVLVDLDSTNGVKVNRREVKRAVLANGDRVDLGASELHFERRP